MSHLPREVLKWVLSLDLSLPVKNIKRDFANGFLFAEIVMRYFPGELQMHSFENASSTAEKQRNWAMLTKFFKKWDIWIDDVMAKAIMTADGDAAVEALLIIFHYLNSPTYRAQLGTAPLGTSAPPKPPGGPLIPPDKQGHDRKIPERVLAKQHEDLSHLDDAARAREEARRAALERQAAEREAQKEAFRQQVAQDAQSSHAARIQKQREEEAARRAKAAAAKAEAKRKEEEEAKKRADGPAGHHLLGNYDGEGRVVKMAGLGNIQDRKVKHQDSDDEDGPNGGGGAGAAAGGRGGRGSFGGGEGGVGGRRRGVTIDDLPPPTDRHELFMQNYQILQQLIASGNPDAMRIWKEMQAQQAASAKAEMAVQEYHRQMALAMQQLKVAANQQFDGSELEILAFSRKPRPVEFRPYELSEFKAKNFDIKSNKGYWQLNRRAQTDSEETAAKKKVLDEMKDFADKVNKLNMERLQQQTNKAKPAPPPKGIELRSKIKDYSASVPLPAVKKAAPSAQNSNVGNSPSRARRSAAGGAVNDLEAMMMQRDAAGGQYAAMYAELEKALSVG